MWVNLSVIVRVGLSGRVILENWLRDIARKCPIGIEQS